MSDDHLDQSPSSLNDDGGEPERDTDVMYEEQEEQIHGLGYIETQRPASDNPLARQYVGGAVHQGSTPADMLERAVERGLPPEALEKFMDLYERWQQMEARKAFYAAMARFRAECPEFEKDGHVRYETNSGEIIEYWHPTLANITNGVNPVLGRHGLAFRWVTEQDDGVITVHCDVFHEGGHVERTTLQGAPDQSGKKNAIQQVGSTITYLQRYTIQAALGVATTSPEEDDDGRNAVLQEPMSPEQAWDLKELLRLTGKDVREFLEFAGGYPSVDEIPAILYSRLKLRLNERLEKLRESGRVDEDEYDTYIDKRAEMGHGDD